MNTKHGIDAIMKLCVKCKGLAMGIKDITEMFGKDRTRPDGLAVYCRTCRKRPKRTTVV